MKVKKVKYTQGENVEIWISHPEKERLDKINLKAEPHQTFKDSLKKLTRHFVLILELETIKDLNQVSAKILDKYPAKGFSVTEFNGVDRYVLTGYRKISTGEGSVINTPWRSTDNDLYPHMDKLRADVERVQLEAIAYLEGKTAGSDQTELTDEIAQQKEEIQAVLG